MTQWLRKKLGIRNTVQKKKKKTRGPGMYRDWEGGLTGEEDDRDGT